MAKKPNLEDISGVRGHYGSFIKINRAFAHIYGMNAASVLDAILYRAGKQSAKELKNGNWKYKMTKADLSLDSTVSLSSLQKKGHKSNPITKLQDLGMAKMTSRGANLSSLVLFNPTRIQEVFDACKIIRENDLKIKAKLSGRDEARFMNLISAGKKPTDINIRIIILLLILTKYTIQLHHLFEELEHK